MGLTKIEMEFYASLLRNLPRIADALEKIAENTKQENYKDDKVKEPDK